VKVRDLPAPIQRMPHLPKPDLLLASRYARIVAAGAHSALACTLTNQARTMMSAEDVLQTAIEQKRPCVLFLGQHMPVDSNEDQSVLRRLLSRKARPSSAVAGWSDALSSNLTEEDYEWLTERFERTVLPESAQEVFNLPWSAVFTSSIDPRLVRRLETRGRQPEAIVSAEHYPRVPRSTARPPTYYLFGRAGDTTEAWRCPRTSNELARRLARHTSVLLARIPDTATSVGLLVVEGYRATQDWLPVDSLLGAIPPGEGMKVLWLGSDETVQTSRLFAELTEAGCVASDPRSLAEIITELKVRGSFTPDSFPVLHEPGVISFSDNAFLEIAPSLRLRVEASAAIVDDAWTMPPSPLTLGAEEDHFRRFHGDPGSARALVEGVSRGFCIKRSFEKDLESALKGALTRQGARDRVLVVHGQSGTGKSIALARLAYLARDQLHLPVLFATGHLPEAADVDAFCEEVDRAGHSPTILLCDANLSCERYFALADALRSRGRRFLVVGTSYLQEGRHTAVDLIPASADTDDEERVALSELVARFAGGSPSLDPSELRGENVFALFYRTISAGRPRLASGLTGEAWFTESSLRTRSRKPRKMRADTQMAQKLIAAGLHAGEALLFENVEDATHGDLAPGRLIDYVMVAGRIDVHVPLNLLLRALRAREPALDYQLIGELFGGLDLFRLKHADEEETELLVGPRLRLEAELICRRRLAHSERELDCIVDLIEAVRPRGLDQDSELRFLLDLLQKLDREGPRSNAYADGYLRVGEALTKLRTAHGVEDASLMLQESHFRRAWLLAHRSNDGTPADTRDRVLDEARAVVEEAIRKIESKEVRAGKRTRENLYVERASIYGFLAVGHAINSEQAGVVWADYLAARVATRKAMNVAPSYFPFDVALWTPADILKEASIRLSEAQRSELVADIYSTLDRIDPRDLGPGQLEKFHVRRTKVGGTLEDSQLELAASRDLERVNPQAATFLRARRMCADVLDGEGGSHLDPTARELAADAGDYLRGRGEIIAGDLRCLRLLLELEWVVATGERLLRGERRPVPFDRSARETLLRLVREIRSATADAPDNALRYLEAVLCWVLGEGREAWEVWKSLARETEFEDRRRVVRRLVVANADGTTTRHRGRILEARTPGHWTLEVEGKGGRIELLERDFRHQVFKVGAEVRDFAIAFNFLGPIAEPPQREREVER
jgi:hypothetical protein